MTDMHLSSPFTYIRNEILEISKNNEDTDGEDCMGKLLVGKRSINM